METQNQIKRTLTQTEAIEQIITMLDTMTDINRNQLADKVCEHFNSSKPSFANPLKGIEQSEWGNYFVSLSRARMRASEAGG